MALSKAQRAAFEKARRQGAGAQGISLSDGAIRGLIAVVAADLGLDNPVDAPDLSGPSYFDLAPDAVEATGGDPLTLLDQLVSSGPPDTDQYFFSIAALHRARLKYQNILRLQATPTLDQVGPRGLLQYGDLSPKALGALLILRKWLYDVDNRAAQETGYLFEPIIAGAIGGVPRSGKNSPVKRDGTGSGCQVDCLIGDRAYEIKLRVTIAASGQGRWKEELAFPADCRRSGFRPVLVVFDATENPKLTELASMFEEHGGEVHIGEDAWAHLETEGGPTMGAFIDRFVRVPIGALLNETPDNLPELRFLLTSELVRIAIGGEQIKVVRLQNGESSVDDPIPDNAAAVLPGLD